MTIANRDVVPAPHNGPLAVAYGASSVETWARKLLAATQLGEALCRTSFVPNAFRNKPEEATAAILFGDELGLSPMGSLQMIFVISGKPGMYARTMHALVIAHGHEVETVEKTDDRVTVRGRRKGSESWVTETWTYQRADRAGYTSNAKYRTDPQSMLYARALADVCRQIAPDVLAGVAFTVEELEVIDVESSGRGGEPPTSGADRAREAIAAARAPYDPRRDGRAFMADEDEPTERNAVEDAMHRPAPGYPEGTAAAYPDPPESAPAVEDDGSLTPRQRGAIFAAFTEAGFTTDARSTEGRALRLDYMRNVLGREIGSTNDLTHADASKVLDALRADAEALRDAGGRA